MIHERELYERLDSAQSAHESSILRKEIAKKHQLNPALMEIREQLATQDVTTADSALRIVQPFIERPQWIGQIIDDCLLAAGRDPYFLPPIPPVKHGVYSGWLLLQHPALAITLTFCDSYELAERKIRAHGERSLTFSGKLTIFNFIKSGEACASFWAATAFTDSLELDRAKCWKKGTRTLQDGEVFLIDGRSESFVIDRAAGSMVILQADIALEAAPLQVAYSATTNAYTGSIAVDGLSSRIQMLSTLLRTMEREDAIETLREYLHHKDFFVRWHVMRELIALNAVAALPDLARMAESDPRQEIRSAAARMLSRIETRAMSSESQTHA